MSISVYTKRKKIKTDLNLRKVLLSYFPCICIHMSVNVTVFSTFFLSPQNMLGIRSSPWILHQILKYWCLSVRMVFTYPKSFCVGITDIYLSIYLSSFLFAPNVCHGRKFILILVCDRLSIKLLYIYIEVACSSFDKLA